MRPATAPAAIAAHPRHVVLFAATAGLLLAPLGSTVTLAAAAVAAAGVLTAHVVARQFAPDESQPTEHVVDRPSRPAESAPVERVEDRPLRPDDSASVEESPTTAIVPDPPARIVAPNYSSPLAGGSLLIAIAAAAAVLIGALVADLRIAALDGGPLQRMHGRSLAARVVVLEPVRERAVGPAVARARLLDGPARGEVAVLRVRADAHAGAWPGVGEIVAVEGEVVPLGAFDAYQRRRGADAAVDVDRLRLTGERRGGLTGSVDAARRRAEQGLARGLGAEDAALLRGMVLGQDERLDESVRDDFERSGLAHILAVSGQNVMLLATLVLAAGAVVGVGLRARLVLALALMAFYVPLTGAGPSIQRAGVMGAAGLVAALAGRPAHRWYALGLAALVTLTLNPRASGEPGWQLSFAAVIALLALGPSLRSALAHHMPGPVADVAAITIAATVGTAPLMAFHFQQVSLAALPANLLAAAAIAPVMWLGMLAATAAQLAPALAAPFNALNAPLLGFVQWVADTMAAAPAAVVPFRLSSAAALAAAYGVLAAAILGIRAAWSRASAARGWSLEAVSSPDGRWRWAGGGRAVGGGSWATGGPLSSHGEPGPWRAGRTAGLRVAAVMVAVPVLVLVLATATGGGSVTPPARGELVVSFLDVGQGDATLLQKDGVAVLVDTGPPGGPILRRLDEAGVKRLDALVITHAQSDHEGAALTVLRKVPVRMIVNGGAGWPSAVQDGLPRAAAAARRVAAHAGQVLTLGDIRMRLLWPPPPEPDFRPEGDPNDRALVAHAQVGDFDLLLPADAESNVTAALPLPEVEALKVAHHGSADEGLAATLERTDPEFAAIEVGRDNTYGHPAPSTLSALRAVPHVHRTDREGTIRLRVRGGDMRIDH